MVYMKKNNFYGLKITFLVLIGFMSFSTMAQVSKLPPVSKELYKKVAHLDSVMFDAFNERNLETLKEIFSQDIEFYHDQGGLTHYKQNMDSFEEAFKSDRKVRRELVAGSMEVSPIRGYGAVETGIHRFYATKKGGQEELSSEAKFMTLWQNINGKWKATRIVSFAHQEYLND